MPAIGQWALILTLVISAYTALSFLLGTRSRGRGSNVAATGLSGARRRGRDSDVAVTGSGEGRGVAWQHSARNGVLLAVAGATLASAVLLYLLLSRDLGVRYVSEHVSTYLPTVYTVSAFWAGQEGSLLLWLWLVTLLSAVLTFWRWGWQQPSTRYAIVVASLAQMFLAAVTLLASNPFEVLPSVPAEGQGLNPLLQNFWMVAHPPVVFMGYALYTVPFALALSGLITGQLGKEWLERVRRWSLLAWLFLGMGILMGAWWAYLELGWGGYWGWDPVENSSLIPWLTGTALLHSLMMQQRRQAFKTWNLWLIVGTFLLCVFATFVTRSGIIRSVHAFGQSVVGIYFMAFIVLCLLAFVALLYLRRRDLGEEHEVGSWLSREASLFLTNLLLLGATLVVLGGTLFPTLAELVLGRQADLETAFYERTVGPLAQVIIVLVGVCPWLAWGGASPARLGRRLLPAAGVAVGAVVALVVLGIREPPALVAFGVCAFVGVSLLATLYQGTFGRRRERVGTEPRPDGVGGRRENEESAPRALARLISRNRRHYGAHLVHLGIVLIAVGVTGSSLYQDEVEVALAPGERVDVHGYTLEYQDFRSEQMPGQQRFTAVLDTYRDGKQVATLRPQKDFHWNIEQWVTEVAIRSTLKEDLYVVLAGFESDGLASLRVLVNPLVVWLWIGGAVLLAGGVVAWWPSATERSRA